MNKTWADVAYMFATCLIVCAVLATIVLLVKL